MRRALVAALAACGAAACANVLGFEDLHVGADAGADASADATIDASPDVAPDAGPTCTHTRWPDRPDAGSGGTISFAAALRVVDFGLSNDAGANRTPPGFDLDRFCTVDVGNNSCAATVKSTDFQTYVADKNGYAGGVDNAGYGLLQFLGNTGDSFKQDNLNAGLVAGEFGVVLRVKSYNGMPDDPDVFVEWFPILGVRGADGGPTTPRFDLTDDWIRDSAYWNTLTYDTSNLIDQAAYVSGGKLVARIDPIALSFPIPGGPSTLDITLHDGVIVADVLPDNGTYRLANGTFAGRWATSDLLAKIQRVYHPTLATYICQSKTAYDTVKNVACPARDIMSIERSDGTDAGCNAVSVGARFETALASDRKIFANKPDGGDPCVGAPVTPNDDCN